MRASLASLRAKSPRWEGAKGDSACQPAGNPAQSGRMNRTLPAALLVLLLPLAVQAEPARFKSAEHHVSGIIPDGWKEVGNNNRETALKIARQGAGESVARITVMTYDARENVTPGYDVWALTDKEIEASGASGAVNGEAIKVLKFGRSEIDHLHMVWTLNRRTLPDGATMWQLAYEGVRGTEGITVQLTVAGDEPWYAANESVFSIFIKVLRLSVPKAGG